MTWTGLPQLQTSVVVRLRGGAALLQLLGAGGVFDYVSDRQPYPYVVFDDPFETPDRVFGQGGHECSFLLSIYTQDGSATKAGKGAAGFKSGMLIAEEVLKLLIDPANPLTVTGHDVVDVDVDSIEGQREPDGITRRVDVVLKALLEDNPLAP